MDVLVSLEWETLQFCRYGKSWEKCNNFDLFQLL